MKLNLGVAPLNHIKLCQLTCTLRSRRAFHAKIVGKPDAEDGHQVSASSADVDEAGKVAGMNAASVAKLVQRCLAAFPFLFSTHEVYAMI